MSKLEQQCSGKKVRGPRRLEYIPEKFRQISGIENLATARQLSNLESWLNIPSETRPVFQKLGCSVSHGEQVLKNPPSSTWVASVSGVPQIIHIIKDPRSAYKWMKCANRQWNIADRHEPKPEVTKYWVAVMERADAYRLEADGVNITSVTRRKIRRGPNEGKMEVLVEGKYGWWEIDGLKDKVLRYRAAFGEIWAGEDGSCWVSASQIKPFPELSYGDWCLMENNREAVDNIDEFLESQALDWIWKKLSVVNAVKAVPPEDESIIRSILKKVKLDEIAHEELDGLVPHVSDLLAAIGGDR